MYFCPGKRERMLPSGSGKEIIMSLNEEILKLADEYEDYIIACRRKVHTFAEVAMHENKTHQMILEEAEKLGLPRHLLQGYRPAAKEALEQILAGVGGHPN